jgi:acetyltransferase-like isoleucine patch superfamily enzyme
MTSLHYVLSRLAGRPTCIKDKTTRIRFGARVINNARDPARIRLGPNTVIDGELMVFPHGGQITIGEWCYVGPGTRIWSGANITIGSRVLIAHNVNVFDNLTHPIDPSARHKQARQIIEVGHPKSINLDDQPIAIEDDAWIGASASVMRGLRIGRGAIVGTGSVVIADVPPMTIVAGNPARVIREISEVDVPERKSQTSRGDR